MADVIQLKEGVLFEDIYYPKKPLRLIEASGGEKLRKGVIAVVEGAFGNTEEPNRNKRTYTNQFWEDVLARPHIQQKLKERAMLGEPEHPHTLYARLGKVSHLTTVVKLQPESKTVWGRAEILDTPTGRIVKTLFDADVKVGISSRGAGKLDEKSGKVLEEGYVLGGWDFVSEPSAPNAYPGIAERLIESLSPCVEEIERNPGYYEKLLEQFGVGLSHIRGAASDKKDVDQGNETQVVDPDKSTRLPEQNEGEADTIADLQGKVAGMAKALREQALTIDDLRQAEEESDIERENARVTVETCDEQRKMINALKTQIKGLGGQIQTLKEQESQSVEKQGKLESQALAEKDQEIEHLKKILEAGKKAHRQLEEETERIQEALKEMTGAFDQKVEKLAGFRRDLIQALCEHFKVDMKVLVEGLNKGFSPRDAVERVVEVSPVTSDSTLPLQTESLDPGFELVDRKVPEYDSQDQRPSPSPGFKNTLERML